MGAFSRNHCLILQKTNLRCKINPDSIGVTAWPGRSLPASESDMALTEPWERHDQSSSRRSRPKPHSDTKKTWAKQPEMARSSTPVRPWIRTSTVMSACCERWLNPLLPADTEQCPIVGGSGSHLRWSSTSSDSMTPVICFNINYTYSHIVCDITHVSWRTWPHWSWVKKLPIRFLIQNWWVLVILE